MKTKEEILNPYIKTVGSGNSAYQMVNEHNAIKAMQDFAKQESERVNRELKEQERRLIVVNDKLLKSLQLAEQALETEAISFHDWVKRLPASEKARKTTELFTLYKNRSR